MKILVVCQYYYPEPFRVTDICEELVKRGHEVSVITGEPNYPEGEIYSGYEKHNHKNEVINGVNVHRCRIIPRKTGVLYRFLNYYSFAISSLAYVLSGKCKAKDGRPFDIVFVNQLSPVMMAYAGIAYKKKYRVPLVVYCLDLWPESLLAGGISKGSLIYKAFHIISKRIYREADRICVSSQMFSDYMAEEFGIIKSNVEYLPQYAEDLFDSIKSSQNESGVYNFTFAGNIGSMQSVDTILKAAETLLDEPVHFHIVGSGSELDNLIAFAKKHQLSNVTFHGRQPIERMPEYYEMSDAMLITLKKDPVISMTLPGKVQSYMAAGKPIIGAINGETNNLIRSSNCGYCGSAESVNDLVDNIKRFLNDDILDVKQMELNAMNYYNNNFCKDIVIETLERILLEG